MTKASDIDFARVHDDLGRAQGVRRLVDRVWPRGKAVRVLTNSVMEAPGDRRPGHAPDALPREPVAWADGAPCLRFNTESPLLTTPADLDAMALHAGPGVVWIADVVAAGEPLRRMVKEATALPPRFGPEGDRKQEMGHGGE